VPHCGCDLVDALALTVTQTARYLCVSRTQVYRLIAYGLLPGARESGRIRIPMASIKVMLAAEHLAWLGCKNEKGSWHDRAPRPRRLLPGVRQR
jgi:excisionase family DNA binding protein